EDASLLRPRPEPPPTMRASGAAVGAAAPYPPPPLPILRCLSATALAHRRCFSAATLAHRSRCSAIVLARRHRRSACSGRPSGGRRHGCTSVARAVGGCGGGVGGGPPTPMSSLPLRRPSPIAGRPTSSSPASLRQPACRDSSRTARAAWRWGGGRWLRPRHGGLLTRCSCRRCLVGRHPQPCHAARG
ncbi:Os02g0159000, partial [Oryza sativa Japonica Group]